MNNKEIEQKVSEAICELVPKDDYENISREISKVSQERKVVSMNERRNINIRKIAISVVAACLVVAIGIFGFSYYGNNFAVDSIIDIDVNPSVELKTNKSDRVLEVVAINEDGAEILDGMELENAELKVAVNAIIGSMVKKGYFSELENGILVTVQNKDAEKAERLRESLVKEVDASLDENNVSAPVINQAAEAVQNNDAESFAKENKISYGKALFILSLVEKESSLNSQELAKMSIYEIAKLVNDNNIDIKDIVEYEYDESIFENISDQIEDSNEDRYDNDDDDNINVNNADIISKDEAKAKALAHAGVKAADASFEKVELGRDDGVYEYEIDFVAGKYEYDYEVRATDGAILEADKELRDGYENQNSNNNVQSTSGNASAEYIGVDKAKAKALAHANVSSADAVFDRVELDSENSVVVYEVEFKVGNVEYDYEINAATGAVVKSDKEIDD